MSDATTVPFGQLAGDDEDDAVEDMPLDDAAADGGGHMRRARGGGWHGAIQRL